MRIIALEVYSEASNHGVIRPAGRHFPGSVIQGDSLNILCAQARKIARRLKDLGVADQQLLEAVQDHQENLLNELLHYQRVLQEHGIALPYTPAASPSDLIELVQSSDDAS